MLGLIIFFGLIFLKDVEPFAVSEIKDKDGKTVGQVNIYSLPSGGVLIYADLKLRVKDGWLAFHIHENGVCEPPDFLSAGGHWNPDGKEHGFFSEKGPHKGDFPNFYSQKGQAKFQIYAPWIKTDEVIGKSIVIHENEDDYISQPAGNSGKRIACGVIKKYKESDGKGKDENESKKESKMKEKRNKKERITFAKDNEYFEWCF